MTEAMDEERPPTGGGSERPAGDGAIDPERWALLTAREEQVTRMAATGLASKAIAEQLHLSRRTVDHALQRSYAKLGVPGRAALVGRGLPGGEAP